MSKKSFRRHFLKTGGCFCAGVASTTLLNNVAAVLALSEQRINGQNEWRICNKCHVLFYNGYENNKGSCAAGESHTAVVSFHVKFSSPNFLLQHDIPETPTAQKKWRFCNKCNSLFYNGYPTKGICPSGGSHVAQGYNFVIPHDIRVPSSAQDGWRFCTKCYSMFDEIGLNRYKKQGACAAGGLHTPDGYRFVLYQFFYDL